MNCYFYFHFKFQGENDKPWSLKLSDLDDNISPWHLLHENMILFAEKLSWKNVIKIKDKMDPSKSRLLLVILARGSFRS